MTRSYKAVYHHLAVGAHTLGNGESVSTQLQFSTEDIATLQAPSEVKATPQREPAGIQSEHTDTGTPPRTPSINEPPDIPLGERKVPSEPPATANAAKTGEAAKSAN